MSSGCLYRKDIDAAAAKTDSARRPLQWLAVTNRDLDAARSYHNATKHSYASVRTGGHSLDWANQPAPFKIYPRLDPIPLPREWPQTGVAALSAIAETDRKSVV